MTSATSESSVNEIAALVKKAARGAGYTWSLADEAAYAVAWLCHRGLDGAGAMASHLKHVQGLDLATVRLQSLQQPWVGGPNGLCALACGTALTDALHIELRDLRIDHVISPYLLLPFLAYRNEQLSKRRMRVQCTHLLTPAFEAELISTEALTSVTLSHNSSSNPTEASTLNENESPTANCQILSVDSPSAMSEQPSRVHRTTLGKDELDVLNRLAAMTYAPATEASRQGAGAGTTDND